MLYILMTYTPMTYTLMATIDIGEENLMASDEEEYLYLYEHFADGELQRWFGYFKNRQEVEQFIVFYTAPHIRPVRIIECFHGLTLKATRTSHTLHIPYKRSDWRRAHEDLGDL